MKHLIICREYPPAPSGGIGTYVWRIARFLAEAGETVHVIGQLWDGAGQSLETQCDGRLIVHRLPFDDPGALFGTRPHPQLTSPVARGLFNSPLPAQAFAWEAGLLAEQLVRDEQIDVIEAQEYEAPLCFFQLRRALGLGPDSRPPCIVHLHSPTEFIARHNDWASDAPLAVASSRLEAYTIVAADALLCPSAWLARQVEVRYRPAPPAAPVSVIPLPCGDGTPPERDQATWVSGAVLYCGRLERRKGVLEWIEAAVEVAGERDDVRFEFAGHNVLGTPELSGEEHIRRRIPPALRSRFIFHGHRDRSQLGAHLAQARLAVVPSRWENFPNTCVEAMIAGLPVLASPEGGMAEMLEHGRTGWIAASCAPHHLAQSLREALDAGPAQLGRMGTDAAVAIRGLCGDQHIVARHIEFRECVRRAGPAISARSSSGVVAPGQSRRARATSPDAQASLAIAVIDWGNSALLQQTIASIRQQTAPPAAVLVLNASVPGFPSDASAAEPGLERGWRLLRGVFLNTAAARNHCLRALRTGGGAPTETGNAADAVAFVDAGIRLAPDFVERVTALLSREPDVGIVSPWGWRSQDGRDLDARPIPEFPQQWSANDVASFAVFRTSALEEAGGFRNELDEGYEHWDAANAIMVAGWTAITYPAPLASDLESASPCPAPPRHTHTSMHRSLLERFPELVGAQAVESMLLAAEATRRNLHASAQSPPDSRHAPSARDVARVAMRSPLASGRVLLGRIACRLRVTASKLLKRLGIDPAEARRAK